MVHFYEKGLGSFQAMALLWENSLRILILLVMSGPSDGEGRASSLSSQQKLDYGSGFRYLT